MPFEALSGIPSLYSQAIAPSIRKPALVSLSFVVVYEGETVQECPLAYRHTFRQMLYTRDCHELMGRVKTLL